MTKPVVHTTRMESSPSHLQDALPPRKSPGSIFGRTSRWPSSNDSVPSESSSSKTAGGVWNGSSPGWRGGLHSPSSSA